MPAQLQPRRMPNCRLGALKSDAERTRFFSSVEAFTDMTWMIGSRPKMN
jgi:hypothetical protein